MSIFCYGFVCMPVFVLIYKFERTGKKEDNTNLYTCVVVVDVKYSKVSTSARSAILSHHHHH